MYPILHEVSKLTGLKRNAYTGSAIPAKSFYSLNACLNNGENFEFTQLQNKKVLIVNTASYCGYTAQYNHLSILKQRFPELEILAFPSNDFKQQEPGDDASIAAFCKLHHGEGYRLFKKCVVTRQNNQHEVYQWLSKETLNGWNNRVPVWNFCKYLINEEGLLTHFFEQGIDPLDKEITEAVQPKADTFDGS